MVIEEQEIGGVLVITPEPYTDERGFFMRTFDLDIFKKAGIENHWVQENHSRTEKKGVVRGLHYQVAPFDETKLIRCIRGEIFDVVADLRKDSKTFGKWISFRLSEQNRKMVLIPRGLAHGFCTITEISEVVYKVDNFYSPAHERGIIWNDPDLNITWPETNPLLSAKDRNNGTFKEFLQQG